MLKRAAPHPSQPRPSLPDRYMEVFLPTLVSNAGLQVGGMPERLIGHMHCCTPRVDVHEYMGLPHHDNRWYHPVKV